MRIQLNGENREIESASLNEALAELGYGDATVATALNGEFVPVTLREQTVLQAGDQLEVVSLQDYLPKSD